MSERFRTGGEVAIPDDRKRSEVGEAKELSVMLYCVNFWILGLVMRLKILSKTVPGVSMACVEHGSSPTAEALSMKAAGSLPIASSGSCGDESWRCGSKTAAASALEISTVGGAG